MTTTLEELERQARELAPDERARLAESLLESLHPLISDVEAAWRSEIENRVSAYDRGETRSYAGEDVFGEARRRCR